MRKPNIHHFSCCCLIPIRSLHTEQGKQYRHRSRKPDKFVEQLYQIFKERTENHVYSENVELKNELSEAEKIEKTVFIKAPRSIDYGRVAKSLTR